MVRAGWGVCDITQPQQQNSWNPKENATDFKRLERCTHPKPAEDEWAKKFKTQTGWQVGHLFDMITESKTPPGNYSCSSHKSKPLRKSCRPVLQSVWLRFQTYSLITLDSISGPVSKLCPLSLILFWTLEVFYENEAVAQLELTHRILRNKTASRSAKKMSCQLTVQLKLIWATSSITSPTQTNLSRVHLGSDWDLIRVRLPCSDLLRDGKQTRVQSNQTKQGWLKTLVKNNTGTRGTYITLRLFFHLSYNKQPGSWTHHGIKKISGLESQQQGSEPCPLSILPPEEFRASKHSKLLQLLANTASKPCSQLLNACPNNCDTADWGCYHDREHRRQQSLSPL